MPPEVGTQGTEGTATAGTEATAQVGATTTAPQPFANDKGEFRADWTASLPEDLRESAALKNIKTVEGMAKSYLSAQRMVGADKVVLPNENTTEDERAEFYSKLGRPDAPEGYEFKPVEAKDLPAGVAPNLEFEKAFANKAFELGLTKEQANGLRDWHQNDIVLPSLKDADGDMEKEHNVAVEALKKKWGMGYQANVDLANKVFIKFDPSRQLIDMGLGNNPALVEMFAAIGKTMSEDKLIVGQADKTPGNAQSEISAMQADLKGPLYNAEHPQHNEYVAKLAALFQQKHPQQD